MRRRAFGALAVAVALALVVSTGGVSAVDADRDVSVRVVDADEAYVGANACQRQPRTPTTSQPKAQTNSQAGPRTNRGNPVEVRLTNRLGDPLDGATVTGLDGGRFVPRQDASRPFDGFVWPGETVEATVTFESAVDHLLVQTRAADGRLTAEVRVTVHSRSHPDCS
jgi:hypothetical protein